MTPLRVDKRVFALAIVDRASTSRARKHHDPSRCCRDVCILHRINIWKWPQSLNIKIGEAIVDAIRFGVVHRFWGGASFVISARQCARQATGAAAAELCVRGD
jgi:hypothetical protein